MAKPGASLSFMTELEEMQCSTFSSSSRFRFSETKRPRVLLSTRGLTNKLSCWLFQLERARDQIGLVADAA